MLSNPCFLMVFYGFLQVVFIQWNKGFITRRQSLGHGKTLVAGQQRFGQN